jgi:hypothetical protein
LCNVKSHSFKKICEKPGGTSTVPLAIENYNSHLEKRAAKKPFPARNSGERTPMRTFQNTKIRHFLLSERNPLIKNNQVIHKRPAGLV